MEHEHFQPLHPSRPRVGRRSVSQPHSFQIFPRSRRSFDLHEHMSGDIHRVRPPRCRSVFRRRRTSEYPTDTAPPTRIPKPPSCAYCNTSSWNHTHLVQMPSGRCSRCTWSRESRHHQDWTGDHDNTRLTSTFPRVRCEVGISSHSRKDCKMYWTDTVKNVKRGVWGVLSKVRYAHSVFGVHIRSANAMSLGCHM